MAIVLGIILGLLPGIIWLTFYLNEDVHPEPKKLLTLTFLTGGAFAFLALFLEYYSSQILSNFGIFRYSLLALVVFAFIEELIKFLAAYICVHKNPAFDEPVDAMIYLIVAALGFATVENLGALTDQAIGFADKTALLISVFQITTIRFIGATLLHSIASGFVGYFWAMDIRRFYQRKYLVIGLTIATAIHAVFNWSILVLEDVFYPTIFLVILGVIILNYFEKLKKISV